MPTKKVFMRFIEIVGVGALAIETLWLFANIGYRTYLAETYHWRKYVNHVAPSFLTRCLFATE